MSVVVMVDLNIFNPCYIVFTKKCPVSTECPHCPHVIQNQAIWLRRRGRVLKDFNGWPSTIQCDGFADNTNTCFRAIYSVVLLGIDRSPARLT